MFRGLDAKATGRVVPAAIGMIQRRRIPAPTRSGRASGPGGPAVSATRTSRALASPAAWKAKGALDSDPDDGRLVENGRKAMVSSGIRLGQSSRSS